jgi:hypothetical protein
MATKTKPIRPPPPPGIFGVPGCSSRNAWEPVPHKTRQKSGPVKERAEKVVKEIRRTTRRKFSAEEKIRIVLDIPLPPRFSRNINCSQRMHFPPHWVARPICVRRKFWE